MEKHIIMIILLILAGLLLSIISIVICKRLLKYKKLKVPSHLANEAYEELCSFLKANKDKFYSFETLTAMQQAEACIAEIKKAIFDLNKDKKKDIRKEAEKIMKGAEKRVGFNFDPFGINEIAAREEVNFHLKVEYLRTEMELMFDKARLGVSYQMMFFGKVIPEIKNGKDFISKRDDFLRKQLSLCKLARTLGFKRFLEESLRRTDSFLEYLMDEEISTFFKPQFLALK